VSLAWFIKYLQASFLVKWGVEVLLFYTGERKITMIGEVKGEQSTGDASKTGADGTAEQSSNNKVE